MTSPKKPVEEMTTLEILDRLGELLGRAAEMLPGIAQKIEAEIGGKS
jgi:hypothetical protein